ncbi:MAG: sulfurtransferase TusA family protein [Desulfatitalea sp.]|nr:sulfurtransferase TusA family protein [Desulfatitalea sp.]
MAEKADFSLDFRSAITSLALLKFSRVFREMKSNQTLEVLGLDADARTDLFKLMPAAAYELICMDEVEDTSFRVCIRKKLVIG